jgi:hypothetical protein
MLHGSHWLGRWMRFRAGLKAGWDPEPVWSLGGTQNWSGGWVGPRAGLEFGWNPEPVWSLGGTQNRSGVWVDPEPVWRLGGTQNRSGGWVGPRTGLVWVGPTTGLEAGWDPEPVWRLGGTQSRSGVWAGPRAGLEAGWDPQTVWRLGGTQPVWRLGGTYSQSGGSVGPRASLKAFEKWMTPVLAVIEPRSLDHSVRPLLTTVTELSIPTPMRVYASFKLWGSTQHCNKTPSSECPTDASCNVLAHATTLTSDSSLHFRFLSLKPSMTFLHRSREIAA